MNWIKPSYIFTSLVKDFLIIFIIYSSEFNKIFNVPANRLIILVLISYWLLFNYILGQYEINYKLLKIKLLSNIVNTVLILLTSNIIYVTINLITDEINFNVIDFYLFINTTFKIFLYISISQLLIDTIIQKGVLKKNKWLVLLSEQNYTQLIKINSSFKNNFKFIKFTNHNQELNYKEIQGLIIDSRINYEFKKLNIYHQIKKGDLEILNILNWYEKYLQISPNNQNSLSSLINLQSRLNPNSMKYRMKRIGDIFFSLFLIVTLSPLIITIILFLFFLEGKPIFYSQIRTGLNTKYIKIIKFRTMVVNAEINGPQWSDKHDKRVTFIGKLLRKFRLDELPQLINVIKGDMSLVGPRPERPEFDKELKKKITNYNFRYSVKPGLSGWAQVNYHYSSNFNDVVNKLNYDIYYIKHQSIFLDLIILFKTIKIIFFARGWVSKF